MRQEDEGLATEQFPELNRQFYAASPAAYFKGRLHSLVTSAGAIEELAKLLANKEVGTEIPAQSSSIADQMSAREHQAFVTAEAEVLFHHLAEALLRLFFAHADGSPCPWLECARLRSFVVFNRKVEEFSSSTSASLREKVSQVFLGSSLKPNETDKTETVETILRLLKILAERLLKDKNLYNSAKHGLAIITGSASISLGDAPGGAIFGHEGPSIAYLEVSTERQWHVTTRWLNTYQTILLTSMTITQLHALWTIAKYRYAGVEVSGVSAITREALDNALKGKVASSVPITRFSQPLAYYISEPTADEE